MRVIDINTARIKLLDPHDDTAKQSSFILTNLETICHVVYDIHLSHPYIHREGVIAQMADVDR